MGKKIMKVIINIVLMPLLLIVSVIMGIISVGIVLFYGGWIPVLISIIIAAIYSHGIPGILFWKGFAIVIAIAALILAIYYFISIEKGMFATPGNGLGEAKSVSEEFSEKIGNLFAGLSPQAARKRYADLIKANHPDNGGDAAKAQRIINDYKEYRGKI